MSIVFTVVLPPGTHTAERLRRIIRRSRAPGGPTVRFRLDPLSQAAIDDLARRDMSRLRSFASLDEENDEILFVLGEWGPQDGSPGCPPPCTVAAMYPGALAVAIDEGSGRLVVRALPDPDAPVLH